MKKPIIRMRQRYMLTGLLFVFPWIVGFCIFTLYPMIDTAYLSLHKVKITGSGTLTTWVGLNNYRDIFIMDVTFINALMSYLGEIIVYVPLIIVFSLIIAMLLNIPARGVGLFRTIFFLPVIISSGPVMSYLTSNGALHLPGNSMIINVLTASGAFPPSVMRTLTFLINSFTSILWNSGLQILIFLAALQKMDTTMYEAAQIDGASQWVVFWRLTLVALNPMLVINTIFTVITLSVFSLNPIISKIRSDLYMPDLGFGYAAALSWLYFVLLVVIILISMFITLRRDN